MLKWSTIILNSHIGVNKAMNTTDGIRQMEIDGQQR